METRSIAPRPDIALASTAARVTPTPPRASKFGEVFSNTVVRSAESAVRMLPGSPMMAVAVRGAAGATGAMGVPMGASPGAAAASSRGPEGPVTATSTSALTTTGASGVSGATTAGGEAGGIEASLQHSQDMNLYFLKIQEDVNAQNRQFTVLSNVMKAEHDTVKTAIGNIR